ncbi:hypothetical protein [Pararhizobium sp. PWRC1-1]|uniref:hypothetical protein n=1 Tax=Pararhizobium sp. PWRC1-1 TaxID=2804566 RepID=UPI003CE72CE5
MKAATLSDHRVGWLALAWQKRPALAPYSQDIAVTPLSLFGDDYWRFPENWLPPGSEDRNQLRFLGESRQFPGLLRGEDDVLIKQLKEITFSLMYHRAAIRGANRKSLVRPGTIDTEFLTLRSIFHELKQMGVKCISQLTPASASGALERSSGNSYYSRLFIIDKMEVMIHASRLGYMSASVPSGKFIFNVGGKIDDTSVPRGVQPLTELETAHILSASLFLIANAFELIGLVEEFERVDRKAKKVIVASCIIKYPMFAGIQIRFFRFYIIVFLQVSAFHLTGFYLGMRTSEFLSAKSGCVRGDTGSTVMICERLRLVTTTVKASQKIYGHTRFFPVHPYLACVYRVMEVLREKFYSHTDRLFTNPLRGRVWNGSNFNAILNNFNGRHGIERRVSSYVWRKTLVAVVMHVRDKPLDLLSEIMGHASVTEAAGYALSSPFIKRDLEDANRSASSEAIANVVDASKALGGPGIGGRQGKRAEHNIAAMGIAQEDRHDIRDQIALAATDVSISPVKVSEHVQCFKPANQVGMCAIAANDLLADIENCSAKCAFRVELIHEFNAVLRQISHAPTWLSDETVSVLERARLARDLQDQLMSWPELSPEFDKMLESNPDLKRWFIL